MVAGSDEIDEKNTIADGESEHRPTTRELPEYLKQKLTARGILKDDSGKSDPVSPDESHILLIHLYGLLSFFYLSNLFYGG